MTEIRDLFSHKIHSSLDDWPSKLIDIASIFAEFDGKPYDRRAIENRLTQVSPRSSSVARDASKFRDEISAYPAYLGLYRVELIDDIWHVFLSSSAKQFLITEEPNVAAFVLLQMILFQYPNGMGVAYRTGSKRIRIQSNSRDRTLGFVSEGVHLSPFRMICKGLLADSKVRNVSPLEAELSFDEIFVLANRNGTNAYANPSIESVIETISLARSGQLEAPGKYESRFHILNHTNFLVAGTHSIRMRRVLTRSDGDELVRKLQAICSIDNQFNDFDKVRSGDDLQIQIASCSWGKYFDGVRTLGSDLVKLLTNENPNVYSEFKRIEQPQPIGIQVLESDSLYELKPVDFTRKSVRNNKTVYTDPELTRIRRQKANLSHKVLLEKLYNHLEKLGATPLENEHIDLYAVLPSNDKFVFEVKSFTVTNLLSQTRKGVSQLYEYRYRYQGVIGYDVNLFLVYPQEPNLVPWLQEYLCKDRQIGIIWFDENDQFRFSSHCAMMAKSLAT